MKKGIIGAGGFGREIYWSLTEEDRQDCIFFVDEQYYDGNNDKIKPISSFNPNEYELIISIADSNVREKIVNSLPKNTKYFTHIHSSVQIHDPNIQIGEGSIICSGTILTTNIKIGKHSHLNLMTTIGHDNIIGDYFTTAPGVKISGNSNIGNKVYFGTNSSNKEKITICDEVIIGLNSGVVKNIDKPGVYVGTPAIKIK
jgi:sugar O-acyltransferase (sialic acid O-acetyltransferase NeuD family)